MANNYNHAAIVAAQRAYTICMCTECTGPGPYKPLACPRERELHRALTLGEDQYVEAVLAKGAK